ncbi:ATP-dependent DNA helicase DDM1-like [Rhododendron vialii]|uniref:ATP-dependent DNA helicase DDM1-like n=1 Tax=Rhododendron vialii TaxID=182163 RepID=UPI0026605529|nr:ATP-dependent DNA helicase DDM1-like [Rhododendron vialii]
MEKSLSDEEKRLMMTLLKEKIEVVVRKEKWQQTTTIERPRELLRPCLQDLKKALILKILILLRRRKLRRSKPNWYPYLQVVTGGKLKSYQLKGVKWLISLCQNGPNGILADQMGLGKTIQTIGFLAHLKGKGMDGPYLVIAPLSTLSNWVNEISRFTPSVNSIIYHGSKKGRDEIRRKVMPRTTPKFRIVGTSYEFAFSDARNNNSQTLEAL